MEYFFPKKAVILAGGKGARLYPITKEIPKPLLPVNKKPIINYLVDLFFSQSVEEIAILINKEYQDDFEWWKKRYYSDRKIIFTQETEPLGTFGGLYFLKDWLAGERFFLTNGDELKKLDLAEMVKFHQKIGTIATIALVKVPNPHDYGMVVCESDLVKEFLEKPSPAQILNKFSAGENPSSNYISSGLYLFSSEIFKYHPGPNFLMVEKDLFPNLAEEKKLAGFRFDGKWMDCGTFERYSLALENWKEN